MIIKEQLFETYDYYKNVKNQYVKSGRELEYYSYHPHTNNVVVPIINKEATRIITIKYVFIKTLTLPFTNLRLQ